MSTSRQQKSQQQKIWLYSFTVASLTIATLAGPAANAVEPPSSPASVVMEEDWEKSLPFITTYEQQNLVAKPSSNPDEIIASVTVSPKYFIRQGMTPTTVTPKEFWQLNTVGYEYIPEPQLPYILKLDEKTGQITLDFKTAALNKSFKFNLGVVYSDEEYEDTSLTVNLTAEGDQGLLNNTFNPYFNGDINYLSADQQGQTLVVQDAPDPAKVKNYSVEPGLANNWEYSVDATTGALHIKAKDPEKMPVNDETFDIPVTLTYIDGSQDQLIAHFKWVNTEAMAYNYLFEYTSSDGIKPGQEYVSTPIFYTLVAPYPDYLYMERTDIPMPEGTTFRLLKNDFDGVDVSINPATGEITYKVHNDITVDHIEVPVEVTFADGSINNEIVSDLYLDLTPSDPIPVTSSEPTQAETSESQNTAAPVASDTDTQSTSETVEQLATTDISNAQDGDSQEPQQTSARTSESSANPVENLAESPYLGASQETQLANTGASNATLLYFFCGLAALSVGAGLVLGRWLLPTALTPLRQRIPFSTKCR